MRKMRLAMDIEGIVNDSPIVGSAVAEYDPSCNVMRGKLIFSAWARTFNELAVSATSIMSVNCSLFSRAVAGATNLIGLVGNHVDGTADFRLIMLDDGARSDGGLVGVIKQEFSSRFDDDGGFVGKTRLDGWYRGPTNIATSPGYIVYLSQRRAGEIEGVYGQQLLDENGTPIVSAFCRRVYRYDTEASLPFEQTMAYKVIDIQRRIEQTTDGERLVTTFMSQAQYQPVI